jgi:hypothetical protein
MTDVELSTRAAAIILTAALAAPPPAAAQANRWERTVTTQLQRTVTTLRPKGFEWARLSRRGSLNSEESASFPVTLEAGRSYAVIGACDDDCNGIGLVLANAAGSELAASQTGDNVPVLEFTAPISQPYRVRVIMTTCRVNPCWYGVALVEKR